MTVRWKKPTRQQLANKQYIADYENEQAQTNDDHIRVYRGLGDEDFPEPRGSLIGSLLQKLSHTSVSRSLQIVDQRSLLSEEDVDVDCPEPEVTFL